MYPRTTATFGSKVERDCNTSNLSDHRGQHTLPNIIRERNHLPRVVVVVMM
jgi:hypothetical protein